MKADELTVFDGTATCDDVPINYDCSYFTKCEFVMPGDELEEMTGSPITAMTFYISSPASASWGAANFQVFMKEVNESTFSIFYGKDFYG